MTKPYTTDHDVETHSVEGESGWHRRQGNGPRILVRSHRLSGNGLLTIDGIVERFGNDRRSMTGESFIEFFLGFFMTTL